MNKHIIILGASGHAKVIADIVLKSSDILLGFLDDNKTGNIIENFSVLGKLSDASQYKNKAEFIIGIGDNYIREKISMQNELKWYKAIHPSAQIAIDAKIGDGSAIMANAVINSSAVVGNHCIINTGAIVEHENILENYTHISPNATLCGNVHVGMRTHIGANATIKNNISICSDVVVGVGAVVVKNIEKNGIYFGVPVKEQN